MQNRFCLCGYKIIVKYQSLHGQWRPCFTADSEKYRQQKNRLSVCPNCGTPLDINTLR